MFVCHSFMRMDSSSLVMQSLTHQAWAHMEQQGVIPREQLYVDFLCGLGVAGELWDSAAEGTLDTLLTEMSYHARYLGRSRSRYRQLPCSLIGTGVDSRMRGSLLARFVRVCLEVGFLIKVYEIEFPCNILQYESMIRAPTSQIENTSVLILAKGSL